MSQQEELSVEWNPQAGGLNSDVDLLNINKGDFPVDGPNTGAVNVRAMGKSQAPSYTSADGNTKAYMMPKVVLQQKQFRIRLAFTPDPNNPWYFILGFTRPNGNDLPGIFLAVDPTTTAATLLIDLLSKFQLFLGNTNYSYTSNIVSATELIVDFSFNDVLYWDYGVTVYSNNNTYSSSIEVLQEAIDASMIGDWRLLKSNDSTGDKFSFWTTRIQSSNLDVLSVQNNGGLISVTFTTKHKLKNNELITLQAILGTLEANGDYVVTVLTDDTVLLQGSTFTNAYTTGGTAIVKPKGYGAWCVSQKIASSGLWNHYILLRTREFNFSLVNPFDMRSKRKQDSSFANYFTDKANPMRSIYYQGPYMNDGAITAINPSGRYAYGSIGDEIIQLLGVNKMRLSLVGVFPGGGAGVYSGNQYYAVQGVTEDNNVGLPGDLTNAIPVYRAGYAPVNFIIGDDPNTTTGKIVQLMVSGIPDGIFRYLQLLNVNLINGSFQTTIIKRVLWNGQSTQIITHDGNETEVQNFDPAEFQRTVTPVKSAENVELVGNRCIYSRLTVGERIDLTAFSKTIKHRLVIKNIPAVGLDADNVGQLIRGEYQVPENCTNYMSHMIEETYAYGAVYELIDGSETDAFFVDFIKFDALATSTSGRRTAGLTTHDLTSANDTLVNVFAVDFHGWDNNFLIGGIPFRNLVKRIKFVRAECIPEVLATGWVAASVKGQSDSYDTDVNFFDESTIGYAYNFPSSSVPNNDRWGAFPYFSGGAFSNSDGIMNPTYIGNQAYPPNHDNQRTDVLSFFSPDIVFGHTQLDFQSGDRVHIVGNTSNGVDRAVANLFYKPDVAIDDTSPVWYTAYSGVNPLGFFFQDFPVVELINMTKGEETRTLNGGAIVFSKMATLRSRGPGGIGRLTRACSVEGGPVIRHTNPFNLDFWPLGVLGPSDRGFYYERYFRKIGTTEGEKYGDIFSIQYKLTGHSQDITSDLPQIMPTTLNWVYGDVFNQKTYLRLIQANKFIENASADTTPDFGGWGAGVAFYSQNRINTQMRIKGDVDFPDIFPARSQWDWLTENAKLSDVFYNEGYTPRNEMRIIRSFDPFAKIQKDWGNAYIWSAKEAEGTVTDDLRYFPPFNIKFMDYNNGPIENLLNWNGEMLVFQHTYIERQVFDTLNTIKSREGLEILVGESNAAARKGQMRSRFGTRHKGSCELGKSDKGFDVAYFYDDINETYCRLGFDGVNPLDGIQKMSSFFSDYNRFIVGKNNAKLDQGITSVANQAFREIFLSFRGWKDGINEWVGPTGNYTSVHNFDGERGFPYSALVEYNGLFYGVEGGSNLDSAIFSFDPVTNTYTLLVSFSGVDGSFATGSLFLATDGMFYGMALKGGANNTGTIYKFDPGTNILTNVYDFPLPLTVMNTPPVHEFVEIAGFLYGVRYLLGSLNAGYIFKYELATGTVTVIHNFDPNTGGVPMASLLNVGGVLYGMGSDDFFTGYGILFKINTDGTGYTVLKRFGIDTPGKKPYGTLMIATNGKVYGVTKLGGDNNEGTLFEYDYSTNSIVVVHSFASAHGKFPVGKLIEVNGKLYGGTSAGGVNGSGVMYEYNITKGTYNVLYSPVPEFGNQFVSSFIYWNSTFYGLMVDGGLNNAGVIFKMVLVPGSVYQTGDVVSFELETYTQAPVFYTSLIDNNSDYTPGDSMQWKLIPFEDKDYYNLFTLVYSEDKNVFQFWGGYVPRIYMKYGNTFLTPRNMPGIAKVYEHNGPPGTFYEDAEDGYKLVIQSFLTPVINIMKKVTKKWNAVRASSTVVPAGLEVKTKSNITYMAGSEFEERIDYFDVPVKNDITLTGKNDDDTDAIRGKWAAFKFYINPGNIFSSFIAKFLPHKGNEN